MKTFVAKLNSICNVGKPVAERVRIVGQLQLDNAGEFMSREFTEYLEDESIARTTCPPHVHQLNGVAKRSIRSIMEIVRATHEVTRSQRVPDRFLATSRRARSRCPQPSYRTST